MSADSLVAEFARAKGEGAFPNISRSDVVAGLRARLDDPTSQDQSAASLCGPASFLYCVLCDLPEVYVKYVVDLYNNGSATLGALTVRPGPNCRKYRPPPDKIAPVDWIALASLRDSENNVLDLGSADDSDAGATMPYALADWFRAVGYRDVRNVTNMVFSKGRSDIDDCNQMLMQGRQICLFIHTNMLSTTTNKQNSLTANHWVVLTSNARIVNNTISMTFYTWGDLARTPLTGTLSVADFCKNFYGYVASRRP